jgi:type IV pilus assembly protein PilA
MSSFCAACGNSLADGERFCRVCGRDAGASPAASPAIPLAANAPAETSGKAVASLVCGLLFFIPLLFVLAIVFGHLALSEIRKSAGRLKGEGMAIAGLVLGYLWIVGIPVILIIAAIAIPNLLRARMAANESSAVASVRTLNTAEITYSSAHPDRGYTCSLSDLRNERLIAADLASGTKNGYVFELLNCTPLTSGGVNGRFQVAARPVSRNASGVRAFCSDESAVIKVDSNGSSEDCLQDGQFLH